MKEEVRWKEPPLNCCSESEAQQRQKALHAFKEMRADVAESGLTEKTLEEINADIAAVRKMSCCNRN
ncbi:MAG: hypothetical protein IKR30_05240 [Bacteroidales bacterium]|nr:hypothetical protein [Bacteroidales bacterium]